MNWKKVLNWILDRGSNIVYRVATSAQLIASKIKGMNSNKEYVMGLIHYIGRRAGNK